MPNLPTYVLITPAWNEAKFIEQTVKSVVGQTVRPLKWVIVSDGSTDGTDDIVRNYLAEHDWIELVSLPARAQRNFAAKVAAFNAGYARVAGLEYDVIGNLDADVSTDEPQIIRPSVSSIGLFLIGPRIPTGRGSAAVQVRPASVDRFRNPDHVSGACQMFRRECFEDIGGYQPVRSGGVDLIALLSAQAKGWQTRRFDERVCLHHRAGGSGNHPGVIRRMLNWGKKDYLLGSHPGFQLFRSAYQMKNKPYIVGGLLMFSGYFWALVRRAERTMPEELIRIRQCDQLQRLKEVLRHPLQHAYGRIPRTARS